MLHDWRLHNCRASETHLKQHGKDKDDHDGNWSLQILILEKIIASFGLYVCPFNTWVTVVELKTKPQGPEEQITNCRTDLTYSIHNPYSLKNRQIAVMSISRVGEVSFGLITPKQNPSSISQKRRDA